MGEVKPSAGLEKLVRMFRRMTILGGVIAVSGLTIGLIVAGQLGAEVIGAALGVGGIMFGVGMREYKRGQLMLSSVAETPGSFDGSG
jgi:hypothetical protein